MSNINRKNGSHTGDRNPDGTFAGGNPGRRKGARHKYTVAIQALLEGEAEALGRKAVELALGGDTTALRLCLERVCPPRKDVPVRFGLPNMTSAVEAAKTAQAVLRAVSEGRITPLEGAAVMSLVECYRKTLETTELEARISNLEATT